MESGQNFFARQLRKIMKENKITQKELAEKIGITQTMISHWLVGIKNPTLTSLKKISSALNVPISYLIDENGSNYKNGEEKKNVDNNDINKEILDRLKDVEFKILQLENDFLKFKNAGRLDD